MARIRSIKPEFWTDGKIHRLSDSCALFFISLWNFCDDYGYFDFDTLDISLKCSRWRPQVIKHMLSSLQASGQLALSSPQAVGKVINWNHQKISDRRASKWNNKEILWDQIKNDAPGSGKILLGSDRIGEDSNGSSVRTSKVFDFESDPSSVWLFDFPKTKEAQQWKDLTQKAFLNKAPPELIKNISRIAWTYRTNIETYRADLNDLLSSKVDKEENRRKVMTVAILTKIGLISKKGGA